MVKGLVWSKRSLEDKNQIFNYWNKHTGNKEYSRKLEKMFSSSAQTLIDFPFRGRKVSKSNIRFIVKGDYKIFYKLIPDRKLVLIVHIWDSRRDPDDLQI